VKESDYYIVTGINKTMIAERLARGEGSILIGKPGSHSFRNSVVDAFIDLFDHPTINARGYLDNERGSKKVGGEDWQTGWENDRAYNLRRIPKPTGDPATDVARTFFEGLDVGGHYEFKIGFQPVGEQTFLAPGETTLFVPRGRSRRPALVHLLTAFTGRINACPRAEKTSDFRFTDSHVQEIVRYAMADLRTGKVFKRNVQAGMDADTMLG
jgi:hypothetical protein